MGENGRGQRAELPDGWEWSTLADIGTWVGGGTPSKERSGYWEGGSIPWVSPKDMKTWRLHGTRDAITSEAVEGSSAKLFPVGSVAVVVRSGILEHTLPVALVPFEATANQDMRVVTPREGIDPEWLMYALQSQAESIRRACRKDGTTVASIDVAKLIAWSLPVPPLSEQRRIVDAVNETMAVIFEAEATVSIARSSSALLMKTVAERAARIPAPRQPLGVLLRDPLRNGHSAKATDDPSGIRTLTLTAVTEQSFDDQNTKLTTAKSERVKDLWLEPGDILVQRANTPELVGSAALYRGERNWAIFPDLLIRVRPSEALRTEFLARVLQAPSIRKHVRGRAQGIAGSMPKISQSTIEELEVPVPPLNEQDAALEEIERLERAVATAVGAAHQASNRGPQLRRSVLQQAFTGRLVPQKSGRPSQGSVS